MSVACLIIFLLINGKLLKVDPNEMTKKALELAKTTHTHPFKDVKNELENWIKNNLVEISRQKE